MEQGFIKGRRGRWEDVRIYGIYRPLIAWLKRLENIISGLPNRGLQDTTSCRGEDEQYKVMNFRNLRKFAGCENFHSLRNPQAYFAPPKLNTCNKTRPKIVRS